MRETDMKVADCKGTPQHDGLHDWKYERDEYNGLSGGGDYEVYRCTKCGAKRFVELPD